MNKNLPFIIVGVIIIGVGALLLFGQGNKPTTEPGGSSPAPGAPSSDEESVEGIFALDFTDHNGNPVTLNDFAGKTLIVNSWATWCPFCVHELPDFVTAQEEFGDQIVIIVINRREGGDQAQRYVEDLGIEDDLVYLLDPNDSFYKEIGGFGMPETLFINASGETVIHKRGPMDLDEIREKIEETLG